MDGIHFTSISNQFHDFSLKRGINCESLPESMTLFALPRAKKAPRLPKNGRKWGHIPELNLRVEHDFCASCSHHMIAIRVTPATPKETAIIQLFKDLQPVFRAKSRPTRITKYCLFQLRHFRNACAAPIPPGTQPIRAIQDFIQRWETYRTHARNTFNLQGDQN